jgi:hypothetical protein
MYRTFIKLGEQELEFIRRVQDATKRKYGYKNKPPMSRIIRQIILGYQQVVECPAGYKVEGSQEISTKDWGPT